MPYHYRRRGNELFVDVAFDRAKYGPEVLIDLAWVDAMPTFITDAPHALAFYDIMLITQGVGWCWLDDHPVPVRPQTVVFTTPGQVRRWQVRNLNALCVFFPALFLDEFLQDRDFLYRLPFFHTAGATVSFVLARDEESWFRRHTDAMHAELQHLTPDSFHLLRARAYELLVMLSRFHARAHTGATERRTPPLVLRFRALVDRDAPSRHHVRTYAQQLGVSPNHLNTLVKSALGCSAKRVILDRLSLEARRMLLYTNIPAVRIADELGFSDPSYFARFFKRTVGISASRFRSEMRDRLYPRRERLRMPVDR
ncbi:MAG TPA: helix-turn-helix domain-containing protein [Gemmatimonadaceae bacterium]|nr:helix-turn-helix domain-containing protein [Gemmatimonadaceae bacterium]